MVPIQTRGTTPGAGNWAPRTHTVALLSYWLERMVEELGIKVESFGPLSKQVQGFIDKGIIPQDPKLQRQFFAFALQTDNDELAFELAQACPAIDRVVLGGEGYNITRKAR